MYTKEQPTHVGQLLTSAEMIAKAKLDWKVRQAPVLFQGTGLMEYKGQRVNFRDDTGEPIGIVGEGYKILQNSTAFAFLDTFVGSEIEQYVNASAWKGGSRISITAKLPGDLFFAGNEQDRGHRYVDFHTSHDGSCAIQATIRAWRLVCSNGLMGYRKIAGAYRKHTLNMSMSTMKSELGVLNQAFDALQDASKVLASKQIGASEVPGVLEAVGLVPKESVRSTRAKNIIREVSSLFSSTQSGLYLPGVRGTRWGMYNAITEYIDHHRGSNVEKRTESSMIGSGSRIKETALEVLVTA